MADDSRESVDSRPVDGIAPRQEPSRQDELRAWAAEPYHRYMGVEVQEQHDGYCRVVIRPGAHTPRGAGNGVHGGILASLADVSALGAIRSVVGPDDIMSGTAELNISYLRPAVGELVVTEARVLKKGRSLVGVDVDISDGKGRLFCKARILYALRQRGGAG